MKTRFVYVLALAIALCAFTVAPAFAGSDEPVGKNWDDTVSHVVMEPAGAGGSYVKNGAFDDWTGRKPDGWVLNTYPTGGELHWAQIDWAAPNDVGYHNYGLGMFALCNSEEVPGYGIAYSPLNVPASGDYWAVVHATAWGDYDEGSRYNSVAWYAIANTSDPAMVPDSAWRELYPDTQVCKNGWEKCGYLVRAEEVYIEKGSYIFLKAEMKFAEYYNWTAWGFDDIAVWDMEDEALWGPESWVLNGVVNWDKDAER